MRQIKLKWQDTRGHAQDYKFRLSLGSLVSIVQYSIPDQMYTVTSGVVTGFRLYGSFASVYETYHIRQCPPEFVRSPNQRILHRDTILKLTATEVLPDMQYRDGWFINPDYPDIKVFTDKREAAAFCSDMNRSLISNG